jgi:hypothetical protein
MAAAIGERTLGDAANRRKVLEQICNFLASRGVIPLR